MTKPMDIIKLIDKNGYTKGFFGYKKETKNYTHWISVHDNSLQMFGYNTKELDSHIFDTDKIYDTGIINVDDVQLQCLIDLWVTNYD